VEERDAWVVAIQMEIARHAEAVCGNLKVSEGTFKWVGDTMVQSPLSNEKAWKRHHWRLLEEPGYLTLAYYENWDDGGRLTKLVGDYRLTPDRVQVIPKLEMSGVLLNYAFELVSPKKSVYFMADADDGGGGKGRGDPEKMRWVNAICSKLDAIQERAEAEAAAGGEGDGGDETKA